MRPIVAAILTIVILALVACGDQSPPSQPGQRGSPPAASPSATVTTATASPSPSATPSPPSTSTPSPSPTAGPTPTTPIATWGNDELYVIDLATLAETRLTNHRPFDGQPAWSPDGSQIAFTRAAEQYAPNGLYLLDAAGGDPRPLVTGEHAIYSPAWSPDGSRIAYIAEGQRGIEIWIVNADGSDPRQLLPDVESDRDNPLQHIDPAWSPDGAQLVFAVATQSPWSVNLWAVNADGSNLRQLTLSTDEDEAPAWSPDGDSIAFTRTTVNDYGRHLYIMDADGSNQRPLLDDNTQGRDPTWSPDGTKIAYVRGLEHATDIFILDLATGDKQQLTTSERDDDEPAWSPDGSRIAFRSNRDGGHPIDCSWEVIADYIPFATVADLISFSDIVVVVTTGEPQPPVFGPVREDGRGESRTIYTDTIVHVEQYVYDESTDADTLRTREEGGKIGDCEQIASPTADLVTSRRYLLFMHRDSFTTLADGWFIVGGNQGALTVYADDTVSAPQFPEIDGLPLAEAIAIVQSYAR